MKASRLAACAAAFSALMGLPALSAGQAAPLQQAAPPPALPVVPAPRGAPDPSANTPALPDVPAPAADAAAPDVAATPAGATKSDARSLAGAGFVAWPGSLSTAQGVLGGLSLPTLAMPGDGRLSLTAALDYHRGGDFLFPDSTSQRTGAALAASYGAQDWLEAYGSLWFHSTNLFAPSGLRTLGSYGDFDAGVKMVLPRRGPISGGALLELDMPSGVGGFSLKGTGGRAALLAGWTGAPLDVPLAATALAGYRVDNSGRLLPGAMSTFTAYALGVSRYDRVEAGVSLAMPFRLVTPSAELELAAPVARQTPLPPGGGSPLWRLTLGAQVVTPAQGFSFEAGVRLALSASGRLSTLSLPLDGFTPDAPWQIFTALAYSFEPRLPKAPQWSRDRAPVLEKLAPEPAAPTVQLPPARARVLVMATDARTHLPVAGAWIAWAEGGEPGVVTSADGRARLEHEAGPATIAVAHEKYELFTEAIVLAAGEERQLALELIPNETDATLRGRLIGVDAVPLRAALQLVASAGGKPFEPRWCEGSYSFPVPHGQYTLQIATPGFRADPLQLEVRPGETVTRDVLLRRLAGESTARMTAHGAELSRPVPFVPSRSALFPVAFPVLGELAALLQRDGRTFVIEVRVEQDDLPPGGDAEGRAQVLSTERARAVVEFLNDKGVAREKLQPRGGGLGKAGQLLFEATPAEEKAPRTQAAPADDHDTERHAALGGRP